MSSSMWSLQVNSEKFTKYLSKILSVDLQQIVDTKASELMHRHCDIYKPLIKGICECSAIFRMTKILCVVCIIEMAKETKMTL